MNYAIFLKLCDRMRFEVNCAKSHHCVISDGLLPLTIEVPCEQRLHVCGMGWCAKSSLFGQPFIMHAPDLPHDSQASD